MECSRYPGFNVDNESTFFGSNETQTLLQLTYFKFSSSDVINTFRDIYINCWNLTINEMTIPKILEYLNLTEHKLNKIPMLEKCLKERLLQSGRFDLILMKAKKYADKYIFNLPKEILIEDVPNDEEEIWKQIEELENKILYMRVKIQCAKKKKRMMAFCQEFIKTFGDENE